jgi:predicted RNase H-like HicB family nuclease
MKKTNSRPPTESRKFNALLQRDGKWFIAFCPEVPGANGQGRTKKQCLVNLAAAIKLMLDIQEEELANLTQGDTERTLLEIA